MNKLFKNQSGITLIELAITVTMIGILTSVGILTYNQMRVKAIQMGAKVHLGAIYSLFFDHRLEHSTLPEGFKQCEEQHIQN